ncbi:trihelix transcription factor ASIL2-like [Rosa chinensis]|uniref:trihelix transcription factor ASIL2-like n=1 Tax=Rosa chinensis TaxID=74649 RepID=UPI000D0891FD|nr:trihelix transcription factor ASIL2-like [Rosa chinensis]
MEDEGIGVDPDFSSVTEVAVGLEDRGIGGEELWWLTIGSLVRPVTSTEPLCLRPGATRRFFARDGVNLGSGGGNGGVGGGDMCWGVSSTFGDRGGGWPMMAAGRMVAGLLGFTLVAFGGSGLIAAWALKAVWLVWASMAQMENDDEEDDEEDNDDGDEEAEVERERERDSDGEIGGGGGEGLKRLARAIERFGEVYQRVEAEKLRQIVELEKQRMQFAKDLEVQRMRMFMDTQVQLERIKHGKRPGSNGEPNLSAFFCML